LGPSLGGALAQPCVNYPGLFAKGTIFDRFPYLLPNLVCTVIVICGLVIGILFLEETHAEKKHRHDPGLKVGRWVLSTVRVCAISKSSTCEKVLDVSEFQSLLDDELLPGYRTTEGSPHMASTPSPEPREPLSLDNLDTPFVAGRPKPAVTQAFTKHVVLNIIGYGILA
jgi:hypothetical protein